MGRRHETQEARLQGVLFGDKAASFFKVPMDGTPLVLKGLFFVGGWRAASLSYFVVAMYPRLHLWGNLLSTEKTKVACAHFEATFGGTKGDFGY